MALTLHQLHSFSKKKRKRIGRGNASGHGTYATRGLKGQRSRSGGRRGLKRRGLKQFLLQLPKKRGFTSHYPNVQSVNIKDLESTFRSGDRVTPEKLLQAGLITSMKNGVKILGHGTLKKKLFVVADAYSQSAESAIKKTGGRTQYRKK
ncbi:50S ribosomal protein L15 [Patescibacteria group bacterium]